MSLPMDISKPLKIAYSGSLDAKYPSESKGFFRQVKNLFWTYKHDAVDPSTRSAYFLIKAIGVLKRDFNITPDEIQIELWGNIHSLNKEHIIEAGVSEFFYIDSYLPKDESLKRLSQADVLFLPLEKSNIKGQGTLFIPGKLFEYLSTRKPILALCEPSDCRDIIENSGLGICIEPDNPELIANVLFPLIKNKMLLLGLIANEEFIETFAFKNKTLELISVLNKASGNLN